eukprot:9483895-Pyramimonas_sp.AAC.1
MVGLRTVLLCLPAQPRQVPVPAGPIMTGSSRGRMNLGLRNPPLKDWLSSRLAAARAMAMAPGQPWTARATRPSTARTRP